MTPPLRGATPRPRPRPGFVPFPREALARSIPERFEAQVDADPTRPAVAAGAVAWSYGALDAAANRVARALLARGRMDRCPVVLLIEQGAPLVAAILGVLKAGAIYVPLETAHPAAHVAAVWAEVGAELIVADDAGAALAEAAAPGAPVLRVDAILGGGEGADGAGAARPGIRVDAGAPAYVYYTSGSTGRPKGVVDSHANVLHNVARYTNSLAIDRRDRLTLLQSPGFSGAVSSLFGALLNGAASVPYDVRREGTAGLGAWLVRERVTIYHSVPALFRRAVAGARAFPDLRLVRLEGDAMSRADWLLFRERCAPGARLVNGLGATECGLVRQFFIDHATPVEDGVVPVGGPVEDMDVAVVDESGTPVPPGTTGEIAVRSRHLACGYWRRPDLDARAFSGDASDPSRRVYRTGDLGRMRADGCLEHLGRLDARARIRGHWVDLADVEAALAEVPGIAEAAVRTYLDAAGDARLVACVVARTTPDAGPAPTLGAVRRTLATRLPDVAVPTALVHVPALPLTATGKVDRTALPEPSGERPRLDVPFVAPRPGLEATIAAIWSEVFGLDRVGLDDPFLDLGGDSLRLGQIHARLQERLPAASISRLTFEGLFEYSTIREMAQHLQE